MTVNTALVAGASGLVGSAAARHLASLPGWQVIGLSRRPCALPPGASHVAVDLAEPASVAAAAPQLRGVTHLVFAALYEKPDLVAGWRDPEQMATNLALLRNLLDVLAHAAPDLRHITLLQGTKAYGSHVGPIRNPAKERWPRHAHENFYWLQEDLLRARQAGAGWTFTILRPQVMLGHATGSPMNVVAALGAYAVLEREHGHPLCFPGGGVFVNGATDADLLARAIAFAGTAPAAAGRTFNVANGDVLVWQDLWPAVAAHFGMPAGEPRPLCLAREMPSREDAWRRLAQRHDLQAQSLAALVGSSWQFTDRVFAHGVAQPAHSVLSTIALRQAGFADCEDTEDCLLRWLARLQAQRLLPR